MSTFEAGRADEPGSINRYSACPAPFRAALRGHVLVDGYRLLRSCIPVKLLDLLARFAHKLPPQLLMKEGINDHVRHLVGIPEVGLEGVINDLGYSRLLGDDYRRVEADSLEGRNAEGLRHRWHHVQVRD